MTYLNNTSETPSLFTSNPAPMSPANMAAIRARYSQVIMGILMWMFKALSRPATQAEADRVMQSKTFRLRMMLIIAVLTLMPGTRAEKIALYKTVFSAAMTKIKALHKAYLKTRQSKCWMWSGGLRAARLAALTDVFAAALDKSAYDGLIPD